MWCAAQAFPVYAIEELRNGSEVGVDLLLDIMEGKNAKCEVDIWCIYTDVIWVDESQNIAFCVVAAVAAAPVIWDRMTHF